MSDPELTNDERLALLRAKRTLAMRRSLWLTWIYAVLVAAFIVWLWWTP